MNKCIFCLKDSDEPLSDEHIVPYAIGGRFVKKILCKSCNNDLGSKIDAPYISSIIIALPRAANEISGGTGQIPNPFSRNGTFLDEGDRVGCRINSDYKPYVGKEIKKDLTEKGLEISIRIDSADKKEIPDIITKIVSRYCKDNKFSKEETESFLSKALADAENCSVHKTSSESIEFSYEINLSSMMLFLIKIVYGLAAVEFGEKYINCSQAGKLRDFLHDSSDSSYENMGSLFVDCPDIKKLMPCDHSHYVMFFKQYAFISIFGMLSVVFWCNVDDKSMVDLELDRACVYQFDFKKYSHSRRTVQEHILHLFPGKNYDPYTH